MRLFVAIQFSPAVRTGLLTAIDALRQTGRGTFTRPENLHMTLAFIGETDRLEAARTAVREAVWGGGFSMSVEGLGRFGNLYWAGVPDNPRLEQLACAVQDALRRHGFAIERRVWKPHITLVRRYRGKPPAYTLRRLTMTVRRVSLMRSDRVQGRLVYTEVESFTL